MKRRDFLRLSAGMAFLGAVPKTLRAEVKRNVRACPPLDIRRREISCGAEKPFEALHVSDTHLALSDARDTERKWKLGATRFQYFPRGEHYLDEAMRVAEEQKMMLIHTGDLIDFVSEANLDAAALHMRKAGWLCSSGNHEFSQYVGEAREDEVYKQQSYAKVQAAFPNDLRFYSHVVNGVNFVALDNVYYYVREEECALMEKEMKRGLPVVLLCHVPFYTPKLCQYSLELSKGAASYLAAVPENITSGFEHDPNRKDEEKWRDRSVQQHADKTTLEFAKWLKAQKQLKAILCGHMHFFFEEPFSNTAMQYVVGAGYDGAAYGFKFV